MSVWIGIDTQFPYMDAFCIAEENYRLAAPGYLFILFSIACGLMAFILLGVMTKMAGRGKGMAEIRLIWFDRWYTELSALIGIAVVVAMTLGVGGIVSFFYVESDRQPEMLIALGVGTAIVWLMFLFFYLSLIRRIKAGTIWKNMLVYRIYLRFRNLLMSIYDDSRNVVRIWVPYLLFIGMNMLLSTMKYGWIVALLVDFFVGVFLYRNHKIQRKILEGIGKIRNGDFDYQIETEEMHGDNRILADAVNSIGNGIREAVKTSMKDERMKADLITNVSHDIKTPLTSIINYVALIKRESVENEKVKQYLEILDSKSQRLKQLTEDLVEASKISSGNIELQCDNLDFVELLNQTVGEFSEKFEEKELQMIMTVDEMPLLIYADSRRIWRVVDNLFQNVCKYALEKTRVYTELKRVSEEDGSQKVQLSIKNISAQPLRVGVEDLTERFIRGDASRSTEGSGLGLSIAKNLTELQKGKFEIISDGDLFKVVITFPLVV